ncbi:ABC transporter permease [Halococcus saccharolyticus]|uniref:Sugar ABC transporter permease n=1 Tax=Halococcus saccharolyticus DSM 5350 TaxID=1227455 RepID=M0MI09_9EURY|nr:ABC transporter permease [Halococcus saccharolyticus]EMA44045.1 sugar ABC transporter permease [Halococcus saccharolyticus DSM 5350]
MSRREDIEAGLARLVAASWVERLLLSLAALAASIVVGGVIVVISGMAATCEEPAFAFFGPTSCYDPVGVYVQLFQGAIGNVLADPFNFQIALTLKETSLLVFTGLSVAVAFRAGLFNIGSQGQLVAGALATALTVLSVAPFVPAGLGAIVLVPLGVIAGAVVGGLYGAIPGALKAYADANEVITTIMLNFVAAQIAFFLVSSYFSAPESQSVETRTVPGAAVLESTLFGSGSNFSVFVFVFGLALVAGLYYLIERTAFGYDLRTSGLQPEAAEYGGVDADRTIVTSMALSGAFAGIGGAVWVLMVTGRFTASVPALGFDGITVSILAGNNPLGVVPAALLFGVLKSGSLALQLSAESPPKQLVGVLRGLIILFVAMPEFFRFIGQRFVTTGRDPVATDGGKRVEGARASTGERSDSNGDELKEGEP